MDREELVLHLTRNGMFEARDAVFALYAERDAAQAELARVREENERLQRMARTLIDVLPDTRLLLIAREDLLAALDAAIAKEPKP